MRYRQGEILEPTNASRCRRYRIAQMEACVARAAQAIPDDLLRLSSAFLAVDVAKVCGVSRRVALSAVLVARGRSKTVPAY